MLANIDKVELITRDADDKYHLVAVVEAGEWAHPDALWHLQEKLNGMASYALDGQMQAEHPESAGRPVDLVVSSVDPFPEAVTQLLAQLREVFARDGLDVVAKRVPFDRAAA